MTDQTRAAARKRTVLYLKVSQNGQPLGHVADLSADGLMLLHTAPLVDGATLSLAVQLPRTIGGELQVDAVCRWSKVEDGGRYCSGLSITNMTAAKLATIDEVIRRFSFEGGSVRD